MYCKLAALYRRGNFF